MNKPTLSTAHLSDGSQVTGVKVAESVHGDNFTLECDGEQIVIPNYLCISFYNEVDPAEFDELTEDENKELTMLEDLSHQLQKQAY